jgi:hypothetical protein
MKSILRYIIGFIPICVLTIILTPTFIFLCLYKGMGIANAFMDKYLLPIIAWSTGYDPGIFSSEK